MTLVLGTRVDNENTGPDNRNATYYQSNTIAGHTNVTGQHNTTTGQTNTVTDKGGAATDQTNTVTDHMKTTDQKNTVTDIKNAATVIRKANEDQQDAGRNQNVPLSPPNTEFGHHEAYFIHQQTTANFSYLFPIAISRTEHEKYLHYANGCISLAMGLITVLLISSASETTPMFSCKKAVAWWGPALACHGVLSPLVRLFSYFLINLPSYKN